MAGAYGQSLRVERNGLLSSVVERITSITWIEIRT